TGFTAAKMRVGGRDGFSVTNCVRRVKAARRGLGPHVELMIDAHGSLEVATAIKLARELEPYDIAWFEEPVSPDDHSGQAEVRRSTTIPIASGEREFTGFDFQDLLERRALDIAQPDVARAGGMTEIRRIAALTSAHGVRLAPHAWGSGVLFAASIHVAMAAANCHILEVSQGWMPMMWELFNEPFDIRRDGIVHAPDRPGLGFTLRADALERFRYVDGPEYKFYPNKGPSPRCCRLSVWPVATHTAPPREPGSSTQPPAPFRIRARITTLKPAGDSLAARSGAATCLQ